MNEIVGMIDNAMEEVVGKSEVGESTLLKVVG